jgi:glycosyltransferase involved in cell wall biosynthesis
MFSRVMRRHRAHYVPPLALLAATFVRRGHEITMLTTAAPEGELVDRESFAEVHYLGGTKPGRVDADYWAASGARFDALHSERKFDIAMGRGSWLWGFFRHSKFVGEVPVISHEGTYPRWLHQIETRFPRAGGAIALPFAPFSEVAKKRSRECRLGAARIVCNSPALATAFRQIFWWNPPKTVFIPYGFELSGYEPADPPSPPRLVFLGRLARDKGLFTLIDVLAGLTRRDVVVEAIGPVNDGMRAKLARYAASRGVAERFVMPGPVHNSEVGQRLAGATAFVFASTHNEGLPKVVMEAMAAGLPVVAYALPGMDTLVVDGVTGHLAPPRDSERFRNGVEALLASPEKAVEMGLAGRRRIATEFEPDAILNRWDTLFREVIAERGGGGG